MKRFYAPPEQFHDQTVTLTEEETRHLRDVMRLRAGDEVQVFDGAGREYSAEIESVAKRSSTLRVIRQIEPSAPESGLDLSMAVSAYKLDKLDLVIQKAVELGVTRLVPVVTFRSEVRLADTLKRRERWRKIALEATKQCERARVMSVEEPLAFETFVTSCGPANGTLLMFSEKDGRAIPTSIGDKKITALIGPKGGWEDSEIELAVEKGFLPVKLGRRILRAETAAITFAALLQHRFGDFN